MLRTLRNQTQSIFFRGFLLLLILGFALWGVGDLTGGSSQNSILSVGKKEITSEEIVNELNRLRYTMPQRPTLQEAINNGMLKTVLDKYEQEILINSEAEALNLFVPLIIQTTTISNEKAFKDPLGKFSQNRFLKSLNNAGISENKYLEMLNTEANYKQLSTPFSYNDIYSNKIVKKLNDWQNETRNFDYIFLKNINKKSIEKPKKNILLNYYNRNKESYKTPTSRDIRYIEIKPSNFTNEIKINDERIKDVYEAEKSKFIIEEERRFYQVVTQDSKKANDFVNKIKAGKNFVKVALNDFSLNVNDIDVGFLKRSELPSEVVKSVFKGKINDLIGPIKTTFGYNTFQIVSIKPEKVIPYKQAYIDIKKQLKKELTLDILYKKIDLIEDLVAEGNNLNEIIASKTITSKLSIQEIRQISKNGIVYSHNGENTYLNKNKAFLEGVWNTPLNDISDTIDLLNDTYVFIETIKENKEKIPAFDIIRNNVYKEWLKKELFYQTQSKLRKMISKKNIPFVSLSAIKRDQKSLTQEINDPLLINKIFQIKENKLNFLNTNNGVMAIKNIKSKVADYKINNKINKEINLSLSNSFFNDFSQSYLELLANKHKLKRDYKNLERFIGSIDNN